MKKYFITVMLLSAILIFIPSIAAQETSSLRGQAFNGFTGLYSIPTGQIGWEQGGNLGLDFGYRAIMNEDGIAHIPTFTISLFKWVEVSTALDIQPKIDFLGTNQNNNDLLFGVKIRLPTNINNSGNPAIALGTTVQLINLVNNDHRYYAYQPYVAITYEGTFFKMSAATTVVFGKTFYTHGPKNNSDIDFGMGFDLVLFPDVFQRYVHWIIDFANFDYSDNSWPNDMVYSTGSAWYRGILNTGFRIDLAAIPALNKFKFAVDLVFNDLFDHDSRSFTMGATFGFSVL